MYFAIWARVDTKFLNLSHHVLAMDCWPGDATVFLRGQPLKIIRMYSAKKKVQPLGFYFWHLRLGLFKSPFLVGEAKHMCLHPFAGMNVFSTKHMCFAIWARVDTQFLNFSHHVLSMDDWPGDAPFSCGANLWRSSACIQPKKVRPSPLDFIFETCASTSSSHCFNVCENDHIYSYPFARTNVSSVKKNVCFAILVRIDTCYEFVPDVQATQIQHNNECMSISKDLNPVKSCKDPYPLKHHGTFFAWGLTYIYVLVNSPPWNNDFPVAGLLYTTGK